MSKLEVKEITPISGETDLKLGQSGGTVTLADGATAIGFGPEYPVGQVRSWVNFNGTGTVAIRESMNVSSITDHGTGNFTINFATAMPDANYSVAIECRNQPDANAGTSCYDKTFVTDSVRIVTFQHYNQTGMDFQQVMVSVIR